MSRAFLLILTSLLMRLAFSEVLPVDQAFKFAVVGDGANARFTWDITDGYYLYQSKFRFVSKTDGISIGMPVIPEGEHKHDQFFGDMVIHRGRVEIRVPLIANDGASGPVMIEVGYQGCADAGICYPPQRRTIPVNQAATQSAAADSPRSDSGRLFDALKSLGVAKNADGLLPADDAFRLIAEVSSAETIRLSWQIAEGYYLYREKFRIEPEDGAPVRLGGYQLPRGEPKYDDEFGDVEIFHRGVSFEVPVLGRSAGEAVRLRVAYQGCADRGVCYPPIEKQLRLEFPAGTGGAVGDRPSGNRLAGTEPGVAEHDRIAGDLHRKPLAAVLLSFLGFGVLLAFTPCIFPMIPILSGIIVGHGTQITTGRAFALSLVYVLASAMAYTLFGVLAGLFGSNLQAVFQTPWVIVLFSTVFVLLAISMFGFFSIHLPASLQTRIAAVSSRQRHGTLFGAAVMGALSALVVGPCVAAPLAGALIYIGQTGDAWLGGAALFSLGFGMGIPLLILGASAGTLLPKAGLWMNGIKAVFGVGLLAVAVWLLERIVPAPVAMFLWALLLIIPAVFMQALDPLPPPPSSWKRLKKGIGVVMLVYGVLMLLGAASNHSDPLQPLRDGFTSREHGPAVAPAFFTPVADGPALDARLEQARAAGQWVMLDYYADWCVSCKEMERYTFSDPRVAAALSETIRLQVDVTANGSEEQALLRRFGLVGPPATLFFAPDGTERTGQRVIGYLDADAFLQHVGRVMGRAL